MGSALYVVLEQALEGVETEMSGKAISRAGPLLDGLAKEIGDMPLMEFYGDDTAALVTDLLEGETPADLASLGGEAWFEAYDGLKTVRALLGHLHERPSPVRDRDSVIGDLQDMERILAAAERHHVRWHLNVDF